jgi:hypothetical protein
MVVMMAMKTFLFVYWFAVFSPLLTVIQLKAKLITTNICVTEWLDDWKEILLKFAGGGSI